MQKTEQAENKEHEMPEATATEHGLDSPPLLQSMACIGETPE